MFGVKMSHTFMVFSRSQQMLAAIVEHRSCIATSALQALFPAVGGVSVFSDYLKSILSM
jgi:hypothetical protein